MTSKQQAIIDMLATAKKTYRFWYYDTTRLTSGTTGPLTLFSTGRGNGQDAYTAVANTTKSFATSNGPQDGKFGQGEMFVADKMWQFAVPQVGQRELDLTTTPAPLQVTDRDVIVEKFHALIGISGATAGGVSVLVTGAGAWAEFTLGQDNPFLRLPLHLIPTGVSQSGVGAYRADDRFNLTYPGAIILENNRQFQVTITLQAGAWNYNPAGVGEDFNILLYGMVLEGYKITPVDLDANAWRQYINAVGVES